MKQEATNRVWYKKRPIRSVSALARTLRFPEQFLRKLAVRKLNFYEPGPTQIKSNGEPRYTWKAKRALEQVHEAIKHQLFLKVEFPIYLHGSLPRRSASSNALAHHHSRILICEDIAGFFDAVTEEQVRRVWRECFQFSEEVSNLLAALTTKGGALPQGAKTSSYLANLVLGHCESELVRRLEAKGVRYTRYVDDISMSATTSIPKSMQTDAIRQVYGLLKHEGLRPKRQKHRVTSSREPMVTTGIQVNRFPSLSKKLRRNVRAAVFQLERATLAIPQSLLNSVAGRVSRLIGFGWRGAFQLQKRISALRRSEANSTLQPDAPSKRRTDPNVNVYGHSRR